MSVEIKWSSCRQFMSGVKSVVLILTAILLTTRVDSALGYSTVSDTRGDSI